MQTLARVFIVLGVVFLAIGGLIYLSGYFHLPLGRLPGDIRIEWKGGAFYFPLATSILLSLFLTGILALIRYFLKR